MYTHACVCACMHSCMYERMQACAYVCMYAGMRACVRSNTLMFLFFPNRLVVTSNFKSNGTEETASVVAQTSSSSSVFQMKAAPASQDEGASRGNGQSSFRQINLPPGPQTAGAGRSVNPAMEQMISTIQELESRSFCMTQQQQQIVQSHAQDVQNAYRTGYRDAEGAMQSKSTTPKTNRSQVDVEFGTPHSQHLGTVCVCVLIFGASGALYERHTRLLRS